MSSKNRTALVAVALSQRVLAQTILDALGAKVGPLPITGRPVVLRGNSDNGNQHNSPTGPAAAVEEAVVKEAEEAVGDDAQRGVEEEAEKAVGNTAEKAAADPLLQM